LALRIRGGFASLELEKAAAGIHSAANKCAIITAAPIVLSRVLVNFLADFCHSLLQATPLPARLDLTNGLFVALFGNSPILFLDPNFGVAYPIDS
jgi:hypothetical protein